MATIFVFANISAISLELALQGTAETVLEIFLTRLYRAIAVFLGVLGLTTEEALKLFHGLCRTVFSETNHTPEMRSQSLIGYLTQALTNLNIPSDTKLNGGLDTNGQCKVALCYSTLDWRFCHMFRNYNYRGTNPFNPTIIEAIVGSWAIEGLFAPVTLGPFYMTETISSGVYGFNNPIFEAIKEVPLALGSGSTASMVLSLGSGARPVVSTPAPGSLQNLVTYVSSENSTQYYKSSGIYFRLLHDMQADSTDPDKLISTAYQYLNRELIDETIEYILNVASDPKMFPTFALPQVILSSITINSIYCKRV